MPESVHVGLFKVVGVSDSSGDENEPPSCPLGISSLTELDGAWIGSLGRCHGAPVFGCVAIPNGIWK